MSAKRDLRVSRCGIDTISQMEKFQKLPYRRRNNILVMMKAFHYTRWSMWIKHVLLESDNRDYWNAIFTI